MAEPPKMEMDIDAEKQMLERLRNEDHEAWQQVYLQSVIPVQYMSTKKGVPFRSIMRDRDIDLNTLYAMLYEDMLAKGGLDKCKFRCPVIYWLRDRTCWLLLGECKEKSSNSSSENADESYYIDRNTHDKWELVNYSFAEIWRKDPMKAYVYFMRKYEKLPSTEIMKYLGISSITNVDQMYSRTKKDMLKLLKEHGGGESYE